MKNPIKNKLIYGRFAASAVAAVLCLGAAQAEAGSIFITGHDSDEHNNQGYMSAGLDFLMFGQAGAPASTVDRATKTVAYIRTDLGSAPSGIAAAGYSVTTFNASADISAVFGGGFDAIMVGSGGNGTHNTELVSHTADFTSYFNAGGSLYVNTDEGFGQSWFDFVPEFGTTTNNTISTSGAFTPTADGIDIGLSEALVDAHPTHSYFTGVDTNIFTVFETTDPASSAFPGQTFTVAFGASDITINEGGEFENSIPEPAAMAIFGLGLAGMTLLGRRRRKAA